MEADTDRSLRQGLELEPEVVLPGQLLARHIPESPERQLMAAVLADAVSHFRQYSMARSRRGQRLFADAVAWIGADDVSWPYAFRNICDHLGIDGDALRSALARWGAQQQARMIDGIRVVRLRARVAGGSRHAVVAHAPALRRSA